MADERREADHVQDRRPLILLGLGGLGALVVVYLLAVLLVGSGVPRGTSVLGVDIGGLSQDEAVQRLSQTLGDQAAQPFRVRAEGEVYTIEPARAGLAFDAQATVAQASGRRFNPLALIGEFFGSHELTPVTTVDRAALTASVGDMALAVDKPPVEPTLTMDGKTPVLTEGADGQALNVEGTSTLLIDQFLQPRKAIVPVIDAVQPTVSREAAKKARALARTAVSGPVHVTTGESKARIKPKAIADALSFAPVAGELQPSLDGAVLYEAVARKLALVNDPGRDASFAIRDGKPVVVPSKVGRGVSDEELASGVLTVIGNEPPAREVAVSVGVREPTLTTEQAEKLGVTERLSTFTQNFPYAAYRVQNIGQAAKYVNGTLLMPGETFSMNDTIKERTEEHGYTVGFVVGPGGVFAEELGGGVSAATTATWTAAFYAGMERVFTQAHSIYISRYQPGLEATVAWGIFDMTFRNDTPNAVFITASTTNTSMTVSFWGTKEYDDIKAEFGEKRAITPFTTIYDKSKKCLGQSGVEGFTIDVDRVFYKDGKEVKRQRITTLYRPAPEVICGKKKPDTEFGGKPKPSQTAKPGTTPTQPAPPDESAPVFGNG